MGNNTINTGGYSDLVVWVVKEVIHYYWYYYCYYSSYYICLYFIYYIKRTINFFAALTLRLRFRYFYCMWKWKMVVILSITTEIQVVKGHFSYRKISPGWQSRTSQIFAIASVVILLFSLMCWSVLSAIIFCLRIL